jgi:hypothetical protein
MQKESECPCPKDSCERHGDCVACAVNHKGKPNPSYCKRPGVAAPAGLAERVSARIRAAGVAGG